MDRREIYKRMLATEALWGLDSRRSCHDIGRLGCHDIEPDPNPTPEIAPGEPYYQISVDVNTGEMTITNFDGQGNEIQRD